MMNDVRDAEYERRLALVKRTIRRTLYTNAALSRRCQEAQQRLTKLRYERFILARKIYGTEMGNPRRKRAGDIVIRTSGNAEDLDGFVSFRRYAGLDHPMQPFWYRCTVTPGPTFTIFGSQNDCELTFSGSSPQEAHEKLITKLNERCAGRVHVPSANQGSSFFGFNQPYLSLTPFHYSFLKIESCLPAHCSFSFDDFMALTAIPVPNSSSSMKEEPKANNVPIQQ